MSLFLDFFLCHGGAMVGLSWLVRGEGRALAIPLSPTAFTSSSDLSGQPHCGREALEDSMST